MNIVTKSFLRHLTRRRSLTLLQLMGVACGVAAAVGMSLSAQSAFESFRKAVEFLSGKSTHVIERPAGPMAETLLLSLMRDPAVVHFSPVLDRRLRLEDGRLVRVLGIDPFLDRAVRPELAAGFTGGTDRETLQRELLSLLTGEGVWVEAGMAREAALAPGRTLRTSHGPLRIIGTFPNPAGEPLLIMDIALAQKLFRAAGRVDHVELILSDAAGFRNRWARGFLIQSHAERQKTFAGMVGAFNLNLQAMSLIALFVSVFLILCSYGAKNDVNYPGRPG